MGTADNKQAAIWALQTTSRQQSEHGHGHCQQQPTNNNQHTGMGTANNKQITINTRAWALQTTNK